MAKVIKEREAGPQIRLAADHQAEVRDKLIEYHREIFGQATRYYQVIVWPATLAFLRSGRG